MRGLKKAGRAALPVLLAAIFWLAPSAYAAADSPDELVPMGNTIGIELKMDGVMIVGLSQVATDAGEAQPAGDAGLLPGDIITMLGDREITCAGDFLTVASEMDGSPVPITISRNDRTVQFTVTPAKNSSGAYQLGLWLRDGVSGIGTMTYYDPQSGVYGALGHGINDVDTGELIPVQNGEITAAEVIDVIKGAGGTPGELCGKMDEDSVIGSIDMNTNCGVFGALEQCVEGEAIPIASESEIVLGPASILSNISGKEVKEYAIEICRIYRDTGDARSVMISVTDPELLEATGGIVQGMSGSPIIQNGKLVGAVTHVLINDPTRGYGISIEKMLNTADLAA